MTGLPLTDHHNGRKTVLTVAFLLLLRPASWRTTYTSTVEVKFVESPHTCLRCAALSLNCLNARSKVRGYAGAASTAGPHTRGLCPVLRGGHQPVLPAACPTDMTPHCGGAAKLVSFLARPHGFATLPDPCGHGSCDAARHARAKRPCLGVSSACSPTATSNRSQPQPHLDANVCARRSPHDAGRICLRRRPRPARRETMTFLGAWTMGHTLPTCCCLLAIFFIASPSPVTVRCAAGTLRPRYPLCGPVRRPWCIRYYFAASITSVKGMERHRVAEVDNAVEVWPSAGNEAATSASRTPGPHHPHWLQGIEDLDHRLLVVIHGPQPARS